MQRDVIKGKIFQRYDLRIGWTGLQHIFVAAEPHCLLILYLAAALTLPKTLLS